MRNNILEHKNILSLFNDGNQKLDLSFTQNENWSESSNDYNDILENGIFYKKLRDNYLYSSEIFNGNNQMRLDDLIESNYNISNYTDNENKIYELLVKSDKTLNEKNNITSEKPKIFRIDKVNKKIGRIKKNSFIKGKHSKLSEDNIIRKIKGRFIEKLRLYINSEYKSYLFKKTLKKKKTINWLKKINPKESRKIKREENLKWFQAKIYEIFSEDISLRYSEYSPDINRKKINRVFLLNEAKNVIQILNSDIDSYYIKYINDEEIEGFQTLKDDIKEIKENMEISEQKNIKEYLERYENTAKNMKQIFYEKNPRNHNLKSTEVNIY